MYSESTVSLKRLAPIQSQVGMNRSSSKMLSKNAKRHNSKTVPAQYAQNRRTENKLIVNGVDVTPKMLYSSIFQCMTEEKIQTAVDYTNLGMATGSNMNLSLGRDSSMQFVNQSQMNLGTISQSLNVIMVDNQEESEGSVEIHVIDDPVPSEFHIPRVPSNQTRPPGFKVLITLRETPTFIHMDRPSLTAEVETEEAEQVEEDNEYYEYITTGKGKNRKIAHAEVQTMTLLQKQRATNVSRNEKKNNDCYTTTWIMYDTYTELQQSGKQIEPSSTMELELLAKETEEGDTLIIKSHENITPLTNDEQLQRIIESVKFKDAAIKMERVLASNVFQEEQKCFKGYAKQDPLRMDVDLKYQVNHLWTFTCEAVEGRCITALCWNTVNKNLIAVGYGKYNYAEDKTGMVCCWCVKNPIQPERIYRFDVPVTSLDFSKDRPNLLAIAFSNGNVLVVDVSSNTTSVVAHSNRKTSPSYEPVWQLQWYHGEGFHKAEEQIMTSGQDGRISRYRLNKEFVCSSLLRLNRKEGKVKGIVQPKKCRPHEIPVSPHPAALVLTRYPADKVTYYVGTDEGCIHICSTNYTHQHLDVFVAHLGPIYTIQFSPFCRHIYLSCGADWCTRIWAEGVFEPLITLTTSLDPIQGAAWSPTNSTIIASVSGNNILMWDMRRKTFVPASTTPSPTEARLTFIQFTESGDNLLVGDVEGSVHIFELTDMPFSPFFQEDSLVSSILKTIITRQDLIILLKKTGKPFTNSKLLSINT